jgi:hypothetical protein
MFDQQAAHGRRSVPGPALVLVLVAVLLALAGSRAGSVSRAEAGTTGVLVINQNVAAAYDFPPPDLTTAAGRAAVNAAIPLMTLAQKSAGQISTYPALAGNGVIIVQVDDPSSDVSLNGKGLVCSPACDNTPAGLPDADLMKAFTVTSAGTFPADFGLPVTATQDNISVDSYPLHLVGAAHDVELSLTKSTVQEGATTCAFNSTLSAPANGAALATYTDIDGNPLVGYFPTIKSSSTATAKVATASGAGAASQLVVTQLQSDGTTIAGSETYCGVQPGTLTISAAPTAEEDTLIGAPNGFARNATLTVTGVAGSIALQASPAAIFCDGTATSTVTAHVTDSAGNNVVDGTPITFSVVALGTANPINTTTTGGTATSVITPLGNAGEGVVVTVTSGTAASSIRIDCAAPGPNEIEGAKAITALPFTGTVNTTGFTTEPGETLPCGTMGATAWYQLTLPLANVAITADTIGSNFNTALAVYSTPPASPPGTLSLLGCNASGANSSVTFVPSPGTYYIQVGGAAGATGNAVLNLRCVSDTDCDGLSNTYEQALGTNPLVADTDGDGLSDGSEILTYGTDPRLADTDGDGYGDGAELLLAKDPLTFCATMRADLNGDGTVYIIDLTQLSSVFLHTIPPAPARDDQNGDGKLNVIDLTAQSSRFLDGIGGCP